MAIRRKVFAEIKPLRVDLGRLGRKLLTGAETELINRICKAGWKVMYIPNAQVYHQIPPERLDKSYIYRIGHGFAASHVILTSDPNPLVVLRWFASDFWYSCRMFFRLIVALLQRKTLWFDDYMRFWIIAQRIPFRIKSLFHKEITPR
jgi:GT2 family glycosyltransferase